MVIHPHHGRRRWPVRTPSNRATATILHPERGNRPYLILMPLANFSGRWIFVGGPPTLLHTILHATVARCAHRSRRYHLHTSTIQQSPGYEITPRDRIMFRSGICDNIAQFWQMTGNRRTKYNNTQNKCKITIQIS